MYYFLFQEYSPHPPSQFGPRTLQCMMMAFGGFMVLIAAIAVTPASPAGRLHRAAAKPLAIPHNPAVADADASHGAPAAAEAPFALFPGPGQVG